MNPVDEKLTDESRRLFARGAMPAMNAAARASMVNRTHRVVRERAKMMQARRSKMRSLWIPMAMSAALVLMICSAVWTVLDGYDIAEITPIGVPDSSDQFLVLLLWFLPVSMALLVAVLFQRMRKNSGGEAMR